MSGSHDLMILYSVLKDILMDWNLNQKLCSITVDNVSTNDVMGRELKHHLCDRGLLVLDGELFHVPCNAHILNIIVQDGL